MRTEIIKLFKSYQEYLSNLLPQQADELYAFLEKTEEKFDSKQTEEILKKIINKIKTEFQTEDRLFSKKNENAVDFMTICMEIQQRIKTVEKQNWQPSDVFNKAQEYETRWLSLEREKFKPITSLLNSETAPSDSNIIYAFLKLKEEYRLNMTFAHSCNNFITAAIETKLMAYKRRDPNSVLSLIPKDISQAFFCNLFIDNKESKDFFSFNDQEIIQIACNFRKQSTKILNSISKTFMNLCDTFVEKAIKIKLDQHKLKYPNHLLHQISQETSYAFFNCLTIALDDFANKFEFFLNSNDDEFIAAIKNLKNISQNSNILLKFVNNTKLYNKNATIESLYTKFFQDLLDKYNQKKSLFYNIPSNSLITILSYLPRPDLKNLSQINSKFNKIIKNHGLLKKSFFLPYQKTVEKWQLPIKIHHDSLFLLTPDDELIITSNANLTTGKISIIGLHPQILLKQFSQPNIVTSLALTDEWLWSGHATSVNPETSNPFIKVQHREDLNVQFVFNTYHRYPIKNLIVSGDKIIAISADAISQWNVKTQEYLSFSKINNPPANLLNAIAMGEKKLLLVYEKNLLLWDIEKSMKIMQGSGTSSCFATARLEGYDVIMAQKGCAFEVYKLKADSDQLDMQEILKPGAQVYHLASSGDGKYIAACLAENDNSTIRIYNTENWQYHTLPQGKTKILYLAFLFTNNALLIADTNGISIHLVTPLQANSKLEQEETIENSLPAPRRS